MEQRIAEKMKGRLESDFIAMTGTIPGRMEPPLTTDEIVGLTESLRATRRWLHGRPVRAMKLGRAQIEWVRQCMAQQMAGPWDGFRVGLSGQANLYGIPCYEVDAEDYYEPIYEDEVPDLAALNERLLREPRAVWGKVETG